MGSSPRVRGKRRWLPILEDLGRLIPACAGKTQGATPARRATSAHPRVCGENTTNEAKSGLLKGSSPRVRGKHPTGIVIHWWGRLIPACAGKTDWLGVDRWDASAHPRVCGENLACTPRTPWKAGSSPRVRGKPIAETLDLDIGGLIPACAGKTENLVSTPSRIRAHPRVCGENFVGISTL